MTIDELLAVLTEQKRALGGATPVAALWDGTLSDLKAWGVQNAFEDRFGSQGEVIIFDVSDYGGSALRFAEDQCKWVVLSDRRAMAKEDEEAA